MGLAIICIILVEMVKLALKNRVNERGKVMNRILAFCFIFIFFSPLMAGGKKSKETDVKKLLSSPDTVVVHGQKLVLNTYLWRDFMPISPPNGKPLQATIKIVPVEDEYIKSTIDADQVWMIHGSEIWNERLEDVRKPQPENRIRVLEKVCRNGPKWDPGSEVTVVVRLQDRDGKFYFLRASKQKIERTD